MWNIQFFVIGCDKKKHPAYLEKTYKTKGNAVKHAKKVFGAEYADYQVVKVEPEQ